MDKRFWDSKALWVCIGIIAVIACEKMGISKEATYQVLALIGGKIGSQAWIDYKATTPAK